MKIKRFNESNLNSNPLEFDINSVPKIWIFVDNNIGVDESVAFKTFFDAVDYYIHFVNDLIIDEGHDEPFEPMTENGGRLFTAVSENPDWEKCQEYAEEQHLQIELIDIPLIR